jgi:hypothetical protein
MRPTGRTTGHSAAHDAVVAAAGAGTAGAGPVAGQHLRGHPAAQLHQVALRPAAVQPGMREVVPKPVQILTVPAALFSAARCSQNDAMSAANGPASSRFARRARPGRGAAVLRSSSGPGSVRVPVAGLLRQRPAVDDIFALLLIPASSQAGGLTLAVWVEPVSGFEPLTVRLQGRFEHCGQLLRC